MNVKCSLCGGSGKFEEYLCCWCGGVGEYLWTEELFGIDPRKKYYSVKRKIEEEYFKLCLSVEKHKIIPIQKIFYINNYLYRNILLKLKWRKIIFDINVEEEWLQLSPRDKRIKFTRGMFIDDNGMLIC